MPRYNPKDPLDKAIYDGDMQKTKELINSGAKMPEHYAGKDSGNLMNVLTKNENAKNMLLVPNIANLDEEKAKDFANLLGYTNKFDTLVHEAVTGGLKKPSEPTQKKQTGEKDKFATKSDAIVKKRWGLAAFVLNHFAYNQEDIDIMSRFKATKEKALKQADAEFKDFAEKSKSLDMDTRLKGMKKARETKKEKTGQWDEVSNLIKHYLDVSGINKDENQKESPKQNSNEPSVTIEEDVKKPVKDISYDDKEDTSSVYSDITEVSKEVDALSLDSSTAPAIASKQSSSGSSREKSVRFNEESLSSKSKEQSASNQSARSDIDDQSYYSDYYTVSMTSSEQSDLDNESVASARTTENEDQAQAERTAQAIESLSAFLGISPSGSHTSQVE